MIQNIFLNLITNLINVFLDFLYPENISCILCDCSISKNTTYSMCKDCFSNINFILDGCIKCGKPIINYSLEEQSIDGCSYCLNKSFYFDKVISCVEYTEISKKIVFGLKYNNKTYLSKYIATIMKEKLDLENIKKYLEDFDRKKYKQEFIKEFEELETLEFIDKKENIILIRHTWCRKNTLCNRFRNQSMYGRKKCFIHISSKFNYRIKRSYE